MIILKILSFAVILQKIGDIYIFFNTRNVILMTISCVIITSDYVIAISYSHLHLLLSDLIQSKSALNQRCFIADFL